MTTYFRRAEISDLAEIMRIERDVFTDEAWSAAVMRAELESSHGFYLVIVDDEMPGVFGYAGLYVSSGNRQADIQTIAVDASKRGVGVGRALMNTLVAEARRRRVDELFLEVRADNSIAQALYKSLGFVELGVRKKYYPGGADAIVMRLKVPPAVAGPAGAMLVSV